MGIIAVPDENAEEFEYTTWVWCPNCWDRNYFHSRDKKVWVCEKCGHEMELTLAKVEW